MPPRQVPIRSQAALLFSSFPSPGLAAAGFVNHLPCVRPNATRSRLPRQSQPPSERNMQRRVCPDATLPVLPARGGAAATLGLHLPPICAPPHRRPVVVSFPPVSTAMRV